jgi:DNA-binding MarR family transcriptional regulator
LSTEKVIYLTKLRHKELNMLYNELNKRKTVVFWSMDQIVVLKHLTDLFMQIGARTTGESLASSEEELTASQLLALRYILLHPDCALSSLAQGLAVSNPAATKVMDRLEKKGLVARVQGSDRRQIKAVLTDKGREVAQDHLQLQVEAYANLIHTLNEEERDNLQKGLEAVIRAAVRAFPDWEQFCLRCGTGCAKDDCLLHCYRTASAN